MALEMQSIPADWLAISFDVEERIRVVRIQLTHEIRSNGGRIVHASFYIMPNTEKGRAAIEAIRNKYAGAGVEMWVLPSHFFDKNEEVRAAYDEAFKEDLKMIRTKLAFIAAAYAGDELKQGKEDEAPRKFTLVELDGKLAQLSKLFFEVEKSISKRMEWEPQPEKRPIFEGMQAELNELNAVRRDLQTSINTRMKANGLKTGGVA